MKQRTWDRKAVGRGRHPPVAAVGYSLAQLKTIQEVVYLSVFVGFSALYFGQALAWNQIVGFGLIGLGAAFVFKPW